MYKPEKIKNCPECDGDDITIESSRELEVSNMFCCDCDYTITGKVPEETLIKRWNRVKRSE